MGPRNVLWQHSSIPFFKCPDMFGGPIAFCKDLVSNVKRMYLLKFSYWFLVDIWAKFTTHLSLSSLKSRELTGVDETCRFGMLAIIYCRLPHFQDVLCIDMLSKDVNIELVLKNVMALWMLPATNSMLHMNCRSWDECATCMGAHTWTNTSSVSYCPLLVANPTLHHLNQVRDTHGIRWIMLWERWNNYEDVYLASQSLERDAL